MFRKKNKIKFLGVVPRVEGAIDPPVKASKAIPEWIKVIPNEQNNFPTAKRCLPLIEACSEGYVWKTHCDIEFEVAENEKGTYLSLNFYSGINHFAFDQGQPIIGKHGDDQINVDKQPLKEKIRLHGDNPWRQVYKFNNLFVVQTPKGYSCRFKSLSNSFNIPIQLFEGVVETDHYYGCVNFPFRYTGPKTPHKYLLKKGTPLIQIIPFKREKWESEVGTADIDKVQKQQFFLTTVFRNAYRNQVKNNGNTKK